MKHLYIWGNGFTESDRELTDDDAFEADVAHVEKSG